MATVEPRASGASATLIDLLGEIVEPERILARPIDLIAHASDASFYRLIPRAVVQPQTIEEIRGLFRVSHQSRIPLTFRGAGTSLSGQAISEGILVEVGRYWRQVTVEEAGKKVRVQPGVIGAHVNHALRGHQVKIGPDPASISTAMMGGILANNSSGMCCGVSQNAYHTLDSLTFVLPSGTVIDTADSRADEIFRERESRLTGGLLELKRQIVPALRERIRAKYRMKNTTGYSLNAFLDFDRAVDIFRHLLIGSEGTLAFIAEAVLHTVPDLPVKYTGLLLFPDLHTTCAAIVPLRDTGAKALELMDRAALASVESQAGIPSSIARLPRGAAGLLVEFQSASEAERSALEARAREAVGDLRLIEPARFTHDPGEQGLLWKIRQGMFPSVGAVRKSGTTVIIEDVAFPIERLADATVELTKLFGKHGYDNAIIFGHAKDGNLHFVITQSFSDEASVEQYAAFMDDLVRLVVERHDGALKAEHGTGRNMGPFVEVEWGADAYAIMKRLKELADPEGLLNPGVIINTDPKAHLANLKRMPVIEDEVDKCIECGFCEPRCPSRDLTLTPRQRIVVRREMARLTDGRGDRKGLAALEADFPYMALDTCAVDGLCATACPVSIDTGQPPRAQRRARRLAESFARLEPAIRLGLRLGHMTQAVVGAPLTARMTATLRVLTGKAIPRWSGDLPRPASGRLPATSPSGAHVVYFPSCISRVIGPLPGEPDEIGLVQTFVALARRAGVPVFIPENVAGICCGVPFASKGYDEGHRVAANRAVERFWEWSDGGRLPVVIDTSPCTYGFATCRPSLTPENQEKFDRLHILDSVAFVHDWLLSRLVVRRKATSVVLHPVCSVIKLGLSSKLERIAQACSEAVTVPLHAGCCGFAGDRGFLFPELTESATRREAEEVVATEHDGYFSSSRTCEIGMTRATGRVYRSYIYLLEQATRD